VEQPLLRLETGVQRGGHCFCVEHVVVEPVCGVHEHLEMGRVVLADKCSAGLRAVANMDNVWFVEDDNVVLFGDRQDLVSSSP
jgi:hypothetical protein